MQHFLKHKILICISIAFVLQGFFAVPLYAKEPTTLAALSLVHITLFDKVISFVEHLFSFPLPTFKAKTTIASPKEVALSSKPLVVSSSFPVSPTAVNSSPTNSLSPSSFSPLILQLSTTLSSLEAKLKRDLAKASEIYLPQVIYLPASPSANSPNTTGGGNTVIYQTDPSIQGQIASLRDMIAATGKIDKLANTTITTPSITGGSFTNVSASGSFSGTFSGTTATLTTLIVSGTGTSTVSGDVAFDTNTLFIDSINNRVGVGTSTPTDTLSLNGPLYVAPISSPSITTDRLYNIANDLYFAGNLIGGGTTGNWTTSGGNVYRTSGNVGISTTSPYAKLSVEGSSALGASALAGYFVATSTTATSTFAGGLTVGTSKLVVDSTTGNVGIGTNAPATPFHVVKEGSGAYISSATYRNSVFSGGLVLTHARGTVASPTVLNDGDRVASIFFKAHDGSASDTTGQTNNVAAIEAWADGSQSSGAFPGRLTFSTAITSLQIEHMRITSAGLVGIGTTSPVSKLSVLGESAFAGGASVGIGYAGTAAPTGGMIIQGNVGIGTTTPYTKLSVEGSSALGASALAGYFTATSTTATSTFSGNLDVLGKAVFGDFVSASRFNATSTTATSTFAGGATFATGGGNVGIGTTLPGYKFEIKNSGTAGAITDVININLGGTTNSTGGGITFNSSDNYSFARIVGTMDSYGSDLGSLHFYTRLAASPQITEKMTITSAGNLGIGTTSPGSILSVSGVGNFASGGSTLYSQLTSPYFTATSTTATSTLSGNLDVLGKAVFGDFVSASRFNATSTTATSTFAGGLTVGGGGGTNGLNLTGHLTFPTDNTYDIGASGANRPRHLYVANQVQATDIYATASLAISSIGLIGSGGASGRLVLKDWSGSDFGRLQFGGTTAAFPAIGRSSNALVVQGANGENGARLGIGTSSPGALLSIEGTSTPRFPLFLVASTTSTSATSTAFIIDANGKVGIGTSSPSADFANAGTAYFAGKVGIGTASPNINYSLDVNGLVKLLSQVDIYSGSVRSISFYTAGTGIHLLSNYGLYWSPTTADADTTADLSIGRSSAGVLEINNGTAGQVYSTTLLTGNIGVGTTTPAAVLSVAASSTNSSNIPLFLVSTSTATATSTAFVINSAGKVGIGGTTTPSQDLSVQGSGLFSGTLSVDGNAKVTGGTLTLNAADTVRGIGGGLTFNPAGTEMVRIVSGALLLQSTSNIHFSSNAGNSGDTIIGRDGSNMLSLKNSVNSQQFNIYASSTSSTIFSRLNIIATTTGIKFISDAAGTTSLPFVFDSTNGGGNVGIGTSSPWARLSVSATSTSATTPLFVVSSSTASASTTAFLIDANGKVSIGTTTSFAPLTVNGEVLAFNYNATSSNATSTFAGGFDVGNGGLSYDFSSGVTSIDSASFGALSLDTNAGVVSWADLPVTSSAPIGTVESYIANMNGNPVLAIYGESNGSGDIANTRVAIGTTTPYAKLSLWGNATTTSSTLTAFEVVSQSSSTLFTVLDSDRNGRVGVGTTTPYTSFSVAGEAAFGSTTFSVFTATTTNATSSIAGALTFGSSTPSARLTIAQTGNVSGAGIYLAATDGDPRSIYMDSSGVLNFYGGDSGTWNTATLNAAGAWSNGSDIAYKEGIVDLSSHYSLNTILSIQPRFYLMKGSHLPQIGFIAQELEQLVPEVVDGKEGKKGISYGNLAALSIQGIQDLSSLLKVAFVSTSTASSTPFASVRLDEIEARIKSLEEKSLSLSPLIKGEGESASQGVVSLVLNYISSTVTTIKSLFVTDLHIGGNVCVDEVCVTKAQFKSLLSQAGGSGTANPAPAAGAGPASSSPTLNPTPYTLNASLNVSSSSSSLSTSTLQLSTDTLAPVITLLGSNPTTLDFGTSYIDLGATVTDNIDKNLGIHTTGAEIDTDIPGTYSVIYTAVDQAGNHATSTRSVIVKPKPTPSNSPLEKGESQSAGEGVVASSSPTLNPTPSNLNASLNASSTATSSSSL